MPDDSRFPKQRTGGVDFRTFTEMAFDEGAGMITEEQLKEWRAMADAATPGPWRLPYEEESMDECLIEAVNGSMTIYDEGGHNRKDAEFIAAAREAVPALLDEVERLRAQLETEILRRDSLDKMLDCVVADHKRDLAKLAAIREAAAPIIEFGKATDAGAGQPQDWQIDLTDSGARLTASDLRALADALKEAE